MSGGLVFGRARRRPVCWGLVGVVVAVAVLAAGCGGGQGEAGLAPGAEGPPSDVGGPPSDEGLPPGAEGPPVDVEQPRATVSLFPGLGRLDAPGGVFTDVAVGAFSGCGVRDTGGVVCWGDGRTVEWAPVDGVFTEVVVWRGADSYYLEDHACALRVDGAVVCWGLELDDAGAARVVARSDSGEARRWELGVGADGASEVFVGIDAGAGGVCAVRGDGSAGCWDGYGWSRDGLPGGGFAEVVVSGLVCGLRLGGGFDCAGGEPAVGLPEGGFADVSAGLGFGCGVRPGGELVCWGDNEDGQADAPLGRFSQVSAGEAHACALGVGGRAVCWGGNYLGKSDAPDGEFAQVAVGGEVSCGVRPGGELVCWGSVQSRRWRPQGVFAQVSVVKNPSLYVFVCAVRADRTAVCWGPEDHFRPSQARWVEMSGVLFGEFAGVSSGSRHVCGVRPDRSAVCRPIFPASGRLGAPGGEFTQVSAADIKMGAGCGVRPDQSAVCWDQDLLGGQLAVSSLDGRFADIDGRGRCGIEAETGEVSCWGSESTGAVGEPPEGVLPLLGVSGGGGVFCGISAADRSLACWPHHSRARLQIPGLPGGEFADVSVGPNGAGCAIRADRELACWGEFAHIDKDFWTGHYEVNNGWFPGDRGVGGELFDGVGGEVEPPGGRFESVDVGARHACAVRVGGAAVCWGHAHDWPYHYDSDWVCNTAVDDCPG